MRGGGFKKIDGRYSQHTFIAGAYEYGDALGLIVDMDLISESGLDAIKITVEENPYPVNYKGEYHYRTGSTKQLLQGSALTNFLLKKTGKKWDSVPLENVTVDDLDKESNSMNKIVKEAAFKTNV